MNEGRVFFSAYRAIFNVLLLVLGVSFILTGVMIAVLEAAEPGEEVIGTVVAVDDTVTKDGYKKVDVYYTYKGEGYFTDTKTDKLDIQQGDYISVAYKGGAKVGIMLTVGAGSICVVAGLCGVLMAKRRRVA